MATSRYEHGSCIEAAARLVRHSPQSKEMDTKLGQRRSWQRYAEVHLSGVFAFRLRAKTNQVMQSVTSVE